jgi:hypothetical protein
MLFLLWRIVVHTKVLYARMWKMPLQQAGLQRIWCTLSFKFYASFCQQRGVYWLAWDNGGLVAAVLSLA